MQSRRVCFRTGELIRIDNPLSLANLRTRAHYTTDIYIQLHVHIQSQTHAFDFVQIV